MASETQPYARLTISRIAPSHCATCCIDGDVELWDGARLNMNPVLVMRLVVVFL